MWATRAPSKHRPPFQMPCPSLDTVSHSRGALKLGAPSPALLPGAAAAPAPCALPCNRLPLLPFEPASAPGSGTTLQGVSAASPSLLPARAAACPCASCAPCSCVAGAWWSLALGVLRALGVELCVGEGGGGGELCLAAAAAWCAASVDACRGWAAARAS